MPARATVNYKGKFMEANERMTLLVAQVKESDLDELIHELFDLEPVLTIHELLLLLKVADQDGTWLWEPIQFETLRAEKEGLPFSSVVGLSQRQLLMLSQQVRLQELGFMEM